VVVEILSPVTTAPEGILWWSPEQCARVQRLCARLTGDPDAAPDLAQETFLEAWRHRDRLVDPTGATAWVDAIARNVCHRHRVRQARQAVREGAVPADVDVVEDPFSEALDHAELVSLVESAMALLSPQARVVLVSRYVDELGTAAIADRLGVSPDAVSMRLQRARARLRHVIETELADEPVAAAWRSRHGLGWRRTRLRCGECGRSATFIRRDAARRLVELKCEHCDPREPSAVFRLDNPQLAALLADVTRPSAVVRRTSEWSHRYWSTALSSGVAACTRCGADVPVRTYSRPDLPHWRSAHGWHTSCSACGDELSTSVAGLVLHHDAVRRLRTAHPGATIVGDWGARLAGRDVRVVGVRDQRSGDGVDVVIDADMASGPTAPAEVLPVR
jgi:RNA polymerase sigma factor (sigma-70 family)